MRRAIEAMTVGAVAAHHLIETAAGLGLPGEPYLGRGRAAGAWTVVLGGNLVLVGASGRRRDVAVAFAAGTYQVLALQHYVDWPWRIRAGLPILTEAEGRPQRVLPAYNAALLTITAGSVLGAVARPASRAARAAQCVGLATLPLQLASARRHVGWSREGRAEPAV